MYIQRNWRPNKFNAKKQTYNGYSYDSKFEAQYASELDLLVKAGEIASWERQVKVPLEVNGKHIANYYVDFKVYHLDGSIEWIETKGFETDVYRIKRRIFEAAYLDGHPNETYTVVKQSKSYYPSAKR